MLLKSVKSRILFCLLIVITLFIANKCYAQTYDYLPGDVNMYYGDWPPSVIGNDVTYLVNYFRGMDGIEACIFDDHWPSADVNGDCIIIGSDVTYLVNYFRAMNSLRFCGTHPPTWTDNSSLPATMPTGWPVCNQAQDEPPHIGPIPEKYVGEGQHLEFIVLSTDPNDDDIELVAEMLPTNAAFYDSGNGHGRFYFDPDYTQVGFYQVRFIATSTIYADTGMADITVYNTNRPPILEPIGTRMVHVGSLLEFGISGYDPDGNIPSFHAYDLPGDASFSDFGDGTAQLSWTPDPADLGNHTALFVASDSDLADSEYVTITVQDTGSSGAIIADHTFCDGADQDWLNIPASLIDTIMAKYDMYYRHTSHGSQVRTGVYKIAIEEGFPDFDDNIYATSDHVGEHGDTTWAPYFRSYLDSHPGCNLASISWCWEHLYYTEAETQIYLDKMNELEQAYPNVTFVYQTGRRYYPSSDPELNHRRHNNQIRQYCLDNNKVLFDFADIESYDPDGNYYANDGDGCDWCSDWCAITENDCSNDCSCAHSHCFNCWQKGRAWWVMLAVLEGWTGVQ